MIKLTFIALTILFINSSFSKTISLMSYNVENLFDTIHDEGKDDYTYLPLALKNASPEIQKICKSLAQEWWVKACLETDWNENVLNNKMKALAKVILSYNKNKGADILVLQEVENLNVVSTLTKKYLRSYRYISLLEGEDSRGIDTAVLSKYPIKESTLHNINLDGVAKKTRGILQVDIKIKRKIFTILANHWPSQSNPDQARLLAAQEVERISLNAKSNIIVAVGDFNTLKTDSPNGIDYLMKNFTNARPKAQALGKKLSQKGTHWYKTEWSYLDKILIFNKTYKIRPLYKSYDVFVRKWMTYTKQWTDRDTGEVSYHSGVPMGFNLKNLTGFSDHLPIVMKFRL